MTWANRKTVFWTAYHPSLQGFFECNEPLRDICKQFRTIITVMGTAGDVARLHHLYPDAVLLNVHRNYGVTRCMAVYKYLGLKGWNYDFAVRLCPDAVVWDLKTAMQLIEPYAEREACIGRFAYAISPKARESQGNPSGAYIRGCFAATTAAAVGLVHPWLREVDQVLWRPQSDDNSVKSVLIARESIPSDHFVMGFDFVYAGACKRAGVELIAENDVFAVRSRYTAEFPVIHPIKLPLAQRLAQFQQIIADGYIR